MSKKTPAKKATQTKSDERTKAKGRPAAHAQTDDARELLMKAAIPLFAQKGFDGTSVKDIADKAGVNSALISYYFKGKEGLYKTCLEKFGKNRLEAAERILQPSQTREECRVRLEMFMEDIMAWFDAEPDLCALVQRESEMNFEIARDVFTNTFVKIFNAFHSFVKAGQTKNYLRTDFDSLIGAQFFFTGLVHITMKNEVGEKLFGVSLSDPVYRRKLKTQISRMFFDGLGFNEESKSVTRERTLTVASERKPSKGVKK